MILLLLGDWIDESALLNVFRYITFRTGAALMTAFVFSLIAAPAAIRWLKQRQKEGQPIRDDGPESHHLTKAGTPTMGGLIILAALTLAVLLWADLTNPYIWIVLLVSLAFGLIGLADDWVKIMRRSSRGIRGRTRLAMQFILAGAAAVALMQVGGASYEFLAFPFFKHWMLPLGIFFPFFVMLVIAGTANSVNLTDGLDGLAIVPVMIAAVSLGVIVYLAGHAVFADYLQIHFIVGVGELAVLCGAIIGAGLGFLWFNAPPARIFMGDTGALALGASLGAIAVAAKHELVLMIIGGLFVLETLSVIIQIVSFKLTGRRVFRMAPFHHHLEKKGWEEPTIVIRLWIVACVLALIGLSTLKLR